MALKESKKLEQANSYELVVTVDGETFEKALNTVYKKEVKKINIPGFRKGKAPRHIIEKMYGKEVFYDDAMQDCYPEALYNAAEEAGVKIVAVESIEVTEVENGFTFKANIVVEPDMEINNYLGFEVTTATSQLSTLKALLTALHLTAVRLKTITLQSVQATLSRALRSRLSVTALMKSSLSMLSSLKSIRQKSSQVRTQSSRLSYTRLRLRNFLKLTMSL